MMRGNFIRKFSTELIVGTLFFTALLILSYFTIVLSTENWFETIYRYEVFFPNVSGLAEGDVVLTRGVKKGKVRKIELVEDGVLVELTLDEEITLHEDYRIKVLPGSILGGRHVAVDPGDKNKPAVARHERLEGEESIDVMAEAGEAITELRKEIRNIRKTLDEEDTIAKVTATVDNLYAISNELRKGNGLISRLINDEELARDTVESVTVLKETGENLSAAAKQTEGAIADIRAGKGFLGKLAVDETLYNDIQTVIGNLRQGKGSLGKFLTEDEVHDNIRSITADVRELVGSVRNGDSSVARMFKDEGELFIEVRNAFSSMAAVGKSLEESEGSLGKMINDDELYQEARHMMLELRSAIEDFREQSAVATFGSFVFGAF